MNRRLAVVAAVAKQRGKVANKCKAHLVRDDGTHQTIEAQSIFIEMDDGRDLTIDLYESRKGGGICVNCLCLEDSGRLEIRLGAANICYINVPKRRKAGAN